MIYVVVSVSQALSPQGNERNDYVETITAQILTGSTAQAEALFYHYDKDRQVHS